MPNKSTVQSAEYTNLEKCQEFKKETVWQVKVKVVLGFVSLDKLLQLYDPKGHYSENN